MPYTLKHCLICYREDDSIVSINSGDGRNSSTMRPSANNQINKNSEICKRFCTLASRYYDIDPYSFNQEKTLCSKIKISSERACSRCAVYLESFCDKYHNWQYIQMQLDVRAHEILQLMMEADNKDSEHAKFREAMADKLTEIDTNLLEDVDYFRDELKESIAFRDTTTYPVLSVAKEPGIKNETDNDNASDISDFVPIIKKVPKKKKSSQPPPPCTSPKREQRQKSPKLKLNKKEVSDIEAHSRKFDWKMRISSTLSSPNTSISELIAEDIKSNINYTPPPSEVLTNSNAVNKQGRGTIRRRSVSVESFGSSSSSDFIPVLIRVKKKKTKKDNDDTNESSIGSSNIDDFDGARKANVINNRSREVVSKNPRVGTNHLNGEGHHRRNLRCIQDSDEVYIKKERI